MVEDSKSKDILSSIGRQSSAKIAQVAADGKYGTSLRERDMSESKKQIKTPVEILCEELDSAIHAAMDLTDGDLNMGDIIGALEITKLVWFREEADGQEEDDYRAG